MKLQIATDIIDGRGTATSDVPTWVNSVIVIASPVTLSVSSETAITSRLIVTVFFMIKRLRLCLQKAIRKFIDFVD